MSREENEREAISELLKFFGVREKEVPSGIHHLEDRLDYMLSSTGILYRKVILSKGWHADATGAMITTLRGEDIVVAVLPSGRGFYEYKDPRTGEKNRITAGNENKLAKEALCFYRPFPLRELKIQDLIRYMAECLSVWDLLCFGLAALAVTLTGMLVPRLNHILIGPAIEYGSMKLLYAVMSFMFFASAGNLLLSMIRSLVLDRIRCKLSLNVSAATMMRLLSLPAGFFRRYSAGELNEYIRYVDSLCGTLTDSIFSTGITGLFSLLYLTQIFAYARCLVWPSLLITLLTLAVSLMSAGVQMKVSRERMLLQAKERGLVHSLITGIQKIRLAGAENRAFSQWFGRYSKAAALQYHPPLILRVGTVITTGIGLAGTAVIYYISVKSRISAADYYAFNAAYGFISSAFSSLTSVAVSAAGIRPGISLIQPFLKEVPEISKEREILPDLSGNIRLSHITFGYNPENPPLFTDLDLEIPAGQFVGIAGRSGSGKSTLVRLMLGFETPQRGSVFFDEKDLKQLDMRSLRRRIGTVMQDGKLFSGTIFENIAITAPFLKLQDAWEAAETACIADDIRNMPMGMHTMIQAGGDTLSGGQRQRLMIARAIVSNPGILIFDEATSALDNITQERVFAALDQMRCTRIVIAHRLSSLRFCDRILVLDQGKIAEDGTYEELTARGEIFAKLAKRQQVN